jgi:NACHT conflict system protein
MFLNKLKESIQSDKKCAALLRWAHRCATISKHPGPGLRAAFLVIVLDGVYKHETYAATNTGRELARWLEFSRDRARLLNMALARDRALFRARALQLGVKLKANEIDFVREFTARQFTRLQQYLEANLFLLECLQLATVTDRAGIESQMVLLDGA